MCASSAERHSLLPRWLDAAALCCDQLSLTLLMCPEPSVKHQQHTARGTERASGRIERVSAFVQRTRTSCIRTTAMPTDNGTHHICCLQCLLQLLLDLICCHHSPTELLACVGGWLAGSDLGLTGVCGVLQELVRFLGGCALAVNCFYVKGGNWG